MNILVSGGAGYLGSHMVRMLARRGAKVTVIDTLEHGHRESLTSVVHLIRANVNDRPVLDRIFSDEKPEAVIHFAGYIDVEESVRKPLQYMENNVLSPLVLLQSMEDHGVTMLIFSSTAAVYGTPIVVPIPEHHEKKPTSPYGLSKWSFEQLLQYYDKKGTIRSMSLRYFNAAGASLDGKYGEAHEPETHIIPLAMRAGLEGKPFSLYGTGYPTKDGTCIRDYIHVEDLCNAHFVVLEALVQGYGSGALNVGTGIGISNKEVIEAVQRETGKRFAVVASAPRPGDPHTLVADASQLRKKLGWKPTYSNLATIVSTAWKWHKNHPNGYKKSDQSTK